MKGRFIVLEGIDGCGKTTQLQYLKEWLPKSGFISDQKQLIITREPGGTELGKKLRQILLSTSEIDIPSATTELLLYAADRAQHVSKLIRPAIENGDWVISDRYSGSTIAYQGYGRQLDLSLIKELEKIATQGLDPDLTLFLNVDINESLQRRQKESNDRIEEEGQIFLEKVIKGFTEIAIERNWINISAKLPHKEVRKAIQKTIYEYFDR